MLRSRTRRNVARLALMALAVPGIVVMTQSPGAPQVEGPAIKVTKTASPASLPAPGGTFRFTVGVTSVGTVNPGKIVTIEDDAYGNLLDPANPNVSNSTCPGLFGSGLGTPVTCSFDATFTGPAGASHTNTVRVVARDLRVGESEDSASATVTITQAEPPSQAIQVTKTASPESLPAPGGWFVFEVRVRVPSTTAGFDLTSLTDDVYGDLLDPGNPNVRRNDCPEFAPGLLFPGDSTNCFFEGRFNGSAGASQTDTVTVGGTSAGGTVQLTENASATVRITEGPQVASVDVTKTVTPASRPAPGGLFSYTVTITNIGNVAFTFDTLVDDVYGQLSDVGIDGNSNVTNNNCNLLETGDDFDPPGGEFTSATCTFDAEFTGPPGASLTDTVTVTGVGPNDQPVTASASATVRITGDTPPPPPPPPPSEPAIEVTKTAEPESRPVPGGTFTFSVGVRNTGDVPVHLISLTDDIYGDLNTQGTCAGKAGVVVEVDASFSCAFDAEFTGAAGESQTDVVTVTAKSTLSDQQTHDHDDATIAITGREPEIEVDKVAVPMALPAPGGFFNFRVQVTNHGDESATITSITDDVYGDLDHNHDDDVANNTCEGANGTIMGEGAVFECSFDGRFTGEAGDSQTDVVSVVARSPDGVRTTERDDATVSIRAAEPAIAVDKDLHPEVMVEPGGTITHDITVTNTGDVDLVVTRLFDDVFGELPGQGNCAVNISLAPGEAFACRFDGTFTGKAGDVQTDTVTAVGVTADGRRVIAADSASATIVARSTPPPELPPPVRRLAVTGGRDLSQNALVALSMVSLGLLLVLSVRQDRRRIIEQ